MVHLYTFVSVVNPLFGQIHPVSETFEWNPVKSNSGKILHTILPELEKNKTEIEWDKAS